MDTTKVCTNCKVEKEVGEFSKQASARDGRQFRCKGCVREYSQSNKAEISDEKKRYYIYNREKILEKVRSNHYKNRDRQIEKSREYNFKNRNEQSYKQYLKRHKTKHKHIVDDTVLPYESIEEIFTGLNTHANAN